MTTMTSPYKLKFRLLYEESTRSVLLPTHITYMNLVTYCKKKFDIPQKDDICLYYEDNSDRIDIHDDEDLQCCITTFGYVFGIIPKIFIAQSKVTYSTSNAKFVDFDLNVPQFCDEPNTSVGSQKPTNNFYNMTSPPKSPEATIDNAIQNIDFPHCFKKGYQFDNKRACMYEIGMKAIREGFQFRVIKSCSKRYSVRCFQSECKWRIYTRKIKDTQLFETSNVCNLHTCSRTQVLPNHRNATRKLIGQLLSEILRDHKRVYTPKDIQKDFNYNWKIDISYKRAWAGKTEALNLINGSHQGSFTELPYYFHNLKLAMEGTVTHIETDEHDCFKMCFVAFGVAIRSFGSYMRPLIKIDAAHLKGPYKGTNLLAVGMDGNNQIIPLATGVSQGETVESWSWFLTKLKECIGEDPKLAIISDRHYAITTAVANVFPTAFHGCCCRHLMMNCKFSSDKFKRWFWKTCKAYTVPEFEKAISGIKTLRPQAYKKLEDAGFERWSRAHCLADMYNYLTSNCVESINALTKHVRRVPITMLMNYYRDLLQKWYFERRYSGEGEPAADELSRFATRKVRRRMLKSATWIVCGVDRFKAYQVKDNKAFHYVDLLKRECSCKKWQLSGLPCGHVCALSRCLGITTCNIWAKAWFSKRTLKGTYSKVVYPLPDPSMWVRNEDIQLVLPPAIVKPLPGRPRNKDRIRSAGEDRIIQRCSRCDTVGHNRLGCHASLPSQATRDYQYQRMDWQHYQPQYTNQSHDSASTSFNTTHLDDL